MKTAIIFVTGIICVFAACKKNASSQQYNIYLAVHGQMLDHINPLSGDTIWRLLSTNNYNELSTENQDLYIPQFPCSLHIEKKSSSYFYFRFSDSIPSCSVKNLEMNNYLDSTLVWSNWSAFKPNCGRFRFGVAINMYKY